MRNPTEEAGHDHAEVQARTDRNLAAAIEVGIGSGKATPQACNEAEVTVLTVIAMLLQIALDVIFVLERGCSGTRK